jgi:UDP-N-acetylglucosamine 1-carboxyvinyltransferase
MHVQELVRMGANIKVTATRPPCAARPGSLPPSAAAVMCSDLRASASLVLAALVADGESILDRVYHMDRGYERIEEKLRGVGAQIRRMGNVFLLDLDHIRRRCRRLSRPAPSLFPRIA